MTTPCDRRRPFGQLDHVNIAWARCAGACRALTDATRDPGPDDLLDAELEDILDQLERAGGRLDRILLREERAA